MNYFDFFAHAASILTGIAYLIKDILWLRLLTIVACIAGIIYNYSVPQIPLWVVIYWNLLFLAINVVQIAIIMKAIKTTIIACTNTKPTPSKHLPKVSLP